MTQMEYVVTDQGTPGQEPRDQGAEQNPAPQPPSDPATMRLSGVTVPELPADIDYGLRPEDQATVEALRPGTALLMVLRGPNRGARFLLDSALTTTGRHPDSDIFLDDVTVSRKHAVFEQTDSVFAVRDVGSLNGTYVNRQRIDSAVLNSGDEVQIGKFRLVFYTPRAAG